MELRHLRYFLAVAENCHFRHAAEELLVSQPTLTQQIKDLEKELKTPLFERVGRRVRLTQAGETFRDYARRSLNVIEEGKAALHEFGELLRGNLTLGVVQTVNAYLTPKVIAEFVTRYPHVLLRVEELSAAEIEAGVSSGKLDLGIAFSPKNERDLLAEPLFEEELVLMVQHGHRLAKRKTLSAKSLADEPLCLLRSSYGTRQMIDAWFSASGYVPRLAVEMNSVEGLLAVTTAGGPATILPTLATQDKRIATVRLVQPTPARTVCLLKSQGDLPFRARDKFVELLKQEIA
ncbi:transcriptional regulator CynR [Bremerella cremea]|uniref:Transcriptional regulator CynR n=1 Tax=Bremerella cremea TaxID=1031537 RepID=A0A368KW64_9BACT|nr:transcriptional regulator CynR [Bremerella cremea]RCS53875.1 transcriptional regulator CynR [Bremerella cremea]